MSIATAAKEWIVVCTNRHKFGQPLRALTPDLRHLEQETARHRFARFTSKEDGEAWLAQVRPALTAATGDYTYTVVDL